MKTVQTMKSHSGSRPQNCTLVRPGIPHSSYGTYVTLAPKVLVFPIFVQVSLREGGGGGKPFLLDRRFLLSLLCLLRYYHLSKAVLCVLPPTKCYRPKY